MTVGVLFLMRTTDMTHKVFVLLSGGADSSTSLAYARNEFPKAEIETVTMDYGQRHRKEIEAAKAVSAHFGAKHVTVPLQGLMQGMLVDKGEDNEAIPHASYAELPQGISPTYVTFRNGLMLSVLAARAQGWVMAEQKRLEAELQDGLGTLDPNEVQATIYCGVHADDGANWAYPDCTPEFIGGMANAIYIGTYNKVRLRTPLLHYSKADVIREGTRLGVPFELTWSCYKGEDLHCGQCPTCLSRKEAFELNGLLDPTTYAA